MWNAAFVYSSELTLLTSNSALWWVTARLLMSLEHGEEKVHRVQFEWWLFVWVVVYHYYFMRIFGSKTYTDLDFWKQNIHRCVHYNPTQRFPMFWASVNLLPPVTFVISPIQTDNYVETKWQLNVIMRLGDSVKLNLCVTQKYFQVKWLTVPSSRSCMVH